MKRREVFFLGGLAAIAVGWQKFGVGSASIEFSPIRAAPSWRYASVGGVSGLSGADFATIGLNQGPPPLDESALEAAVHRDSEPGKVPVAVFSDFFCPYCRGLIGRLAGREASPALAITWHELPLLGPNSVLAAKAAEAAHLQQGYRAFYEQLIRDGFRPLPRWMGAVADKAGLDGAQVMRDMESALVANRLVTSARAAATLGFAGTPGIAIGRSAVLGALDRDAMEALFNETGPLPK